MAKRARAAAATRIRAESLGTIQDRTRAIAISGGGPTVGVSIGFLKAIDRSRADFKLSIDFDVWTMSCVGAWAGCMYLLEDDPRKRFSFVHNLMRSFFRPDEVYDSFPTPTVFLPDFPEMIEASLKFMVDPRSYAKLIVPGAIYKGYHQLLDTYLTPSKWTPGDFANLTLNGLMAPNPLFRMIMGLIYKTDISGISKLWFGKDYSAFAGYDITKLQKRPQFLYHNAYNIDTEEIALFANKNTPTTQYDMISFESLCACSGLPYVLSPMQINGNTYVEGATVNTIAFPDLETEHPELQEIWVSRILDRRQIIQHGNLLQALQNLVMMFACTTAEDDIKLFIPELRRINEVRLSKPGGYQQIELYQVPPVDFPSVTFDWNDSNFIGSVDASYKNSQKFISDYIDARTNGNLTKLNDLRDVRVMAS